MHYFLQSKAEIKEWLDFNYIQNYIIGIKESFEGDVNTNSQTASCPYFVNIAGNVNLRKRRLKSIPVQFNRVQGTFDCQDNNLTTLIGSPHFVSEHFMCNNNSLTSLEGAPQEIGGTFNCSMNTAIKSLKGGPVRVGRHYLCANMALESLEFIASNVKCGLDISNNQISSLKHCPQSLSDNFIASNNMLTSLLEGPQKMGGEYRVNNNRLSSLEGIADVVKDHCDFSNNYVENYIFLPQVKKQGYTYDGKYKYVGNPVEKLYAGRDDLWSIHLEEKAAYDKIQKEKRDLTLALAQIDNLDNAKDLVGDTSKTKSKI